ncbi:ATP-binding cassette domain-containing protein [Pelagibacterium lacus]|nr:ATP-binding cassette domain-containing protein [Pelagibacterium lacus]
MLEISGLAFRYPQGEMDFAFDLTVAPGECVSLEGASGSGKSTLFDLIAGFLTPQSGDIRLDERSILPLPPESRPVSILFQSDNVFEHLSAGANVALGLGNRVAPTDQRVRDALERMGLSGLANRRAANLSGGQRQRVALARTLLRNRPVLLLDEPFSGLDEETAGPIRETIARLIVEWGWHAILVSHQSSDIAALAQRHYRIKNGRTTEVTRPR